MTVSFDTKKPVPRASVVCTSTTAGRAALTTSSRLIGAPTDAVRVVGAAAGADPWAGSFQRPGSVGHRFEDVTGVASIGGVSTALATGTAVAAAGRPGRHH